MGQFRGKFLGMNESFKSKLGHDCIVFDIFLNYRIHGISEGLPAAELFMVMSNDKSDISFECFV